MSNEKLKTVNIKGKEYVEVNERVRYFRTSDEYKGWSLETEIISLQDSVCVMKAYTKDSEGIIKATGHAYEKEDSSFINKTSYIENCETSAVGRALGLLGIGITNSIASREEVENAILNQDTNNVDSDLEMTLNECKSKQECLKWQREVNASNAMTPQLNAKYRAKLATF